MLSEKGTLLNKEKNRKLDYQKKGSQYEIIVYELTGKKVNGQVTNYSFQRMSNFSLMMKEKALSNYLYAEGYTDSK
jgi:hypothetical protein